MMKQKFIKELVKGTHTDTQQQNNAHPKTGPVDCDGVPLTKAARWYLYPYYDIKNPELDNRNIYLKTYWTE